MGGLFPGYPTLVANGGTGATTPIQAAQNLGVPFILAKSAIPFIGLSSGSIAANGALTGITALPTTYANAFVFLPVGAVAPASVAGWYFCQFSSTIAGTVFLNTYTTGVPAIPTVLNPVVAGAGAYVGDTGEEFGPTIIIPANVIGPNGQLRNTNMYSVTNNINAKNIRTRYSGNGGTIFQVINLQSSLSIYDIRTISNRGTNRQVGPFAGGLPENVTSGIAIFGAVDTTLQSTLVFSQQRAVATDNVILEYFLTELISDGS